MPLSSVVVAGNPALASQYNNLRIDAMARIETVTAGEAYSATTPVTNAGSNQAYSLPTLLQQDSTSGKWLKMDGDTVGLGARVRIGMAYEASAGDGSSVKIYLPGSLITGLSAMTAEVGRTASNSSTSGAVESTVLPPYHTYIGWWPSATSFMFEGLMFNNVNPKQVGTPVVSGEAFSVRDALYVKVSDGRAYKSVSTSVEPGVSAKPLFAAQAATGAAQTVLAYTPGAYISGFSGLTPGATYYNSSTAGAISTTRDLMSKVYGYAISSTELLFIPGNDTENLILQSVVAGENWTSGNFLYLKRSDSRFYKVDKATAEPGIGSQLAIAFNTQTGGAGTNQIVIMPGSVVSGYFNFSAALAILPGTSGGVIDQTSINYDQFYRTMGYALKLDGTFNTFHFLPQQMEFIPTGIQEKGYVGMGQQAAGGGGNIAAMGVNFKKIMSNTPSGITFTAITSTNISSGPTAQDINRFGFYATVTCSATPFKWSGTYQTVGN